MSAKGRGAVVLPNEAYPTPGWCTRRMLEASPWARHEDLFTPSNMRILEPCAGDGAIVRELRSEYPEARIDAIEIRNVGLIEGATHSIYGVDAIGQCERWLTADLVLTNPPFSLWQEFARRGLACARWCALLLRIGAIAHLQTDEDRQAGRPGLPTPSLYVLPNRPQFVQSFKCKGAGVSGEDDFRRACGWQDTIPIDGVAWAACPRCGGKVSRSSSDSSEYAWFVWGPQAPTVQVLASTPLAERKGASP